MTCQWPLGVLVDRDGYRNLSNGGGRTWSDSPSSLIPSFRARTASNLCWKLSGTHDIDIFYLDNKVAFCTS
jgi:hypothetical protein